MGKAQGAGKMYSSSGKVLFTGAFARDDIHYEALLGCNMQEAMEMFNESPLVYYTEGETSFLFERAQVILRTDCLIEIHMSDRSNTSEANNDSWYLLGEDGETLPEAPDSGLEEDAQETELEQLPVKNKYNIFFYLSTDEWMKEEDVDFGAINVTGVSSYRSNIDTKFLNEQTMTPENGAAALQECVAIERMRLKSPTAFSNINYQLTTMNRTYIAVSGINLADAVYEEVYELDGIRYRLTYEMDNPNELMFVTYENY